MRFLLVLLSASVVVACGGDTSEESVTSAPEPAVSSQSEWVGQEIDGRSVSFHDQFGDAWNMTIVVMKNTETDAWKLRWLDASGELQFETELQIDGLARGGGGERGLAYIDPNSDGERYVFLIRGTAMHLFDADGFIRAASRIEELGAGARDKP